MNRSGMLLLVVMAGVFASDGCAPPVKGVKQEDTVLKFKMKSLDGKEGIWPSMKARSS